RAGFSARVSCQCRRGPEEYRAPDCLVQAERQSGRHRSPGRLFAVPAAGESIQGRGARPPGGKKLLAARRERERKSEREIDRRAAAHCRGGKRGRVNSAAPSHFTLISSESKTLLKIVL